MQAVEVRKFWTTRKHIIINISRSCILIDELFGLMRMGNVSTGIEQPNGHMMSAIRDLNEN